MHTEIELLTKLREAAQRRDGEGCDEAIEALLSRLPVLTMLRLAHDEVQCRLPLFERHHPDMHWPRLWLETIATGAPSTFDESAPEVLEEAPGPGGNNFTEAVQQLALAVAAEGTKRITCARAAIEGAIMAEAMEAGGSEHRQLWDLWFQEALIAEEHKYSWVLGKIYDEPNVAAAELAAWNRLADELAAALGVKG